MKGPSKTNPFLNATKPGAPWEPRLIEGAAGRKQPTVVISRTGPDNNTGKLHISLDNSGALREVIKVYMFALERHTLDLDYFIFAVKREVKNEGVHAPFF